MAEKQIDLRGLACADRAERIRAALAESGLDLLRVVVDDDAKAAQARDTAARLGWSAAIQEQGPQRLVVLARSETVAPVAAAANSPPAAGQALRVIGFVTSNLFGEGDEPLGRILMRAFIKTLKELDPPPGLLIFANSGVRLTTKGSDLIADLRELESRGVRILSCGTCLDYYRLTDAVEVGGVTNMYDMVTALAAADRVLRP